MLPPKKYDLDFRPVYFDPDDTNHYRAEPEEHPPGSVASDGAEKASGLRPRTLYGDAFLPTQEDTEIELARVELESWTCDIISVRARLQDGRIFYSVVDEYEGQFDYTCKREVSDEPLTMAELIVLMENVEVDYE